MAGRRYILGWEGQTLLVITVLLVVWSAARYMSGKPETTLTPHQHYLIDSVVQATIQEIDSSRTVHRDTAEIK